MRRNNFQVCPAVDGINSRILNVGIITEFYLPSKATLLSIRGERSKSLTTSSAWEKPMVGVRPSKNNPRVTRKSNELFIPVKDRGTGILIMIDAQRR